VTRLLLLFALLFAAAPARADDISAASRGVVRVVVIAFDEYGEVAGFGHGSGFAVAPNRIVTNHHVVAIALEHPKNVVVGVVPSQGSRSFRARIRSADPARDLALLEMEEGTLSPIPLYVGPVEEGSTVTALGYPGNVDLATAQSADDYITPLPATRSIGNYSNERPINGIAALLHTANIARGNSGGPLLDQCGRVIGVNTFITRGDEGDSPFGFAIANRELAAFLRQAGQPFGAVQTGCVGMAERLAQDRDRQQAADRDRLAGEDARRRAEERRLEQARFAVIQERENRVAIAVLLVVLSLVSLGAAGVLMVKDRVRHAAISAGVGAAFLVGAAIVFFTRPSLADVMPAASGAPAQAPPSAFAASSQCRIVPERSRITVSSAEPVSIGWGSSGCVNGRTQYVQQGEAWTRILVPEQEETVSILEIRPGAGEYVVNRYLLGEEAMTRARRLRRRVELKSCTTDQRRLADLAEGLQQIRRILPELPNERLVYRCSAG